MRLQVTAVREVNRQLCSLTTEVQSSPLLVISFFFFFSFECKIAVLSKLALPRSIVLITYKDGISRESALAVVCVRQGQFNNICIENMFAITQLLLLHLHHHLLFSFLLKIIRHGTLYLLIYFSVHVP